MAIDLTLAVNLIILIQIRFCFYQNWHPKRHTERGAVMRALLRLLISIGYASGYCHKNYSQMQENCSSIWLNDMNSCFLQHSICTTIEWSYNIFLINSKICCRLQLNLFYLLGHPIWSIEQGFRD